MTSEEDLLEDAYFKEYGDLEELDADAEDALLGDSDDEDQSRGHLEKDDKGEEVEYVDEDGNPVDIGEHDEVEYVEYSESGQSSENVDFVETSAEDLDVDDVLDLVVDPDLEFDESAATLEESVPYEGPSGNQASERAEHQAELRHPSLAHDNADEPEFEEQSSQSQDDVPDVDSHAMATSESAFAGDSSESEHEEFSGRGRFHSERPNIISLSTAKKRTNIPDSLDGILQNSEVSRSERGRERKSKGHGRSQVERKGRDRGRDRSSRRRSPSQPRRSQPDMKVSSTTESNTSRPPLISKSLGSDTSRSHSDSQGPRKILINPHFKGGFPNTSTSTGSAWMGDLPPGGMYMGEPPTSDTRQPRLCQQPPPPLAATSSVPMPVQQPSRGPVAPAARPAFPFDPTHPPPRAAVIPSMATLPPPPALPDFRHRPPPPVLSVTPMNSSGSILGPPPLAYPPRDGPPPPLAGSQNQSWLQHPPPQTPIQPIHIPDAQRNNPWSNVQPSIPPFNAQLPPQPQRWTPPTHPPLPASSAPILTNFPLVSVDQRPSTMPDIRRPPPPPPPHHHPGQLPTTFTTPPPPLFRLDTPPPIGVNAAAAALWQNQLPRLPAKPLMSSVPVRFTQPPLVHGNFPQKPQLINAGSQFSDVQVEQTKYNARSQQSNPCQSQSLRQMPGPNISQCYREPLQLQQDASWLPQHVSTIHPNSPALVRQRRPLPLAGPPHKVKMMMMDSHKQGMKRKSFQVNSNIKEVKLVDRLPVAEEVAIMDEDEETRRYRQQIELQKKRREEIFRIKEQRRKIMALQRRKQLAAQTVKQVPLQQEVRGTGNNTGNVVLTVAPIQQRVEVQNVGVKHKLPPGPEVKDQFVPGVKKRVVVVRKVSPLATKAVTPHSQTVHLPGAAEHQLGQTRPLGRAKPIQSLIARGAAQLQKVEVQGKLQASLPGRGAPQHGSSSSGGEKQTNVRFVVPAGAGNIVQPGAGAKRVVRSVKAEGEAISTVVSGKFSKLGFPTAAATAAAAAGTKEAHQVVNVRPGGQRRTVIASQEQLVTPNQRTVVVNSASLLPAKVTQQRQVIAVEGKQHLQRRIVTKSNSATVLIENLALSTSEAQVRKICQAVGPVVAVKLNRDQRKAIVTFTMQQNALEFMDKYQRKMVDLSLISISMVP